MRGRITIEFTCADDEDLPDLGAAIMSCIEDADWESVEDWRLTGLQKEAGWINVPIHAGPPKAQRKTARR